MGELTVRGDKLIAISALAREMYPLMQCHYLAGLWEIDLLMQLGWLSRGTELRSTTYRAPSCSWASVDNGVSLFHLKPVYAESYHILAEISAAHVDLIGDDEMG